MSDSDRRPRRPVPLPPAVVAALSEPAGAGEAELLSRLEAALAALPEAERRAVVASHAYGEGAVGAAMACNLSPQDAEALTRSGLQLLRAALGEPPDAGGG